MADAFRNLRIDEVELGLETVNDMFSESSDWLAADYRSGVVANRAEKALRLAIARKLDELEALVAS